MCGVGCERACERLRALCLATHARCREAAARAVCKYGMEEWVSALIGVGIVLAICLCGELADWVREDDDRISGKKVQSNKSYMGAPMRKQFKTFDVESKKKKKKRMMASYDGDGGDDDDDDTSLDIGRLGVVAGAPEVNLTPRGEDGTLQLMSAEQLDAGACSLRPQSLRH